MMEIPRACLTAGKSLNMLSSSVLARTTLPKPLSAIVATMLKANSYWSTLSERFCRPTLPGSRSRWRWQTDEMAVEDGKKTRPDLKMGICGEHGGEPSSIEFCNEIGLNYVSCSPFRVPIARLAAAQAALATVERDR